MSPKWSLSIINIQGMQRILDQNLTQLSLKIISENAVKSLLCEMGTIHISSLWYIRLLVIGVQMMEFFSLPFSVIKLVALQDENKSTV